MSNIEALLIVVKRLGSLRKRVVFVEEVYAGS